MADGEQKEEGDVEKKIIARRSSPAFRLESFNFSS